ncbi:MAG TPA: 3-mercaptopyruvate sulfurtransferase, partial [Rhodospirillaceae bacterium]|nr:3-mercaptopyruvate sulfurtransferase [Rhodospirillaceae bacterium]
DGRPSDRFDGSAPEPREGLKRGHIPHSINLTPAQLMNPDSGTFLTVSELASVFENAGIDPTAPVAMTCGSGVAASALSLARYLITGDIAPVYDGSWSEWGGRDDAPAATKPS